MKPELGISTADCVLDMDYYEKTVGVVKLLKDRNVNVTQSLSFPKCHPDAGKYLVFMGLQQVMDFIEEVRDKSLAYENRLDWLDKTSNGDMKDPFLDYLKSWKPEVSIYSVPEGTPVFPKEHVLSIRGKSVDVQMLETAVLRLCNCQTAKATVASFIRSQVGKDALLEFGARRSDFPLLSTRAVYAGGFDATSYELAGYYYKIPYTGTMSHAYIQEFAKEGKSYSETELEAFRAFAEVYPHNTITLVDTYNVINGVTNTIIVARELREKGYELKGIRLDSGDLASQARISREMLDSAGFPDVKIYVSGDIDAYKIHDLQGLPIRGWGVGTRVVQAHINGRFKLCEVAGYPSMKFSTGKASIPGFTQIWRKYNDRGEYIKDILSIWGEDIEGCKGIKKEFMYKRDRIEPDISLKQIREYCLAEVKRIRAVYKRLQVSSNVIYPDYPVEYSKALEFLVNKLQNRWLEEFPLKQQKQVDNWRDREVKLIESIQRMIEGDIDPSRVFGRSKEE